MDLDNKLYNKDRLPSAIWYVALREVCVIASHESLAESLSINSAKQGYAQNF